MDLKAREEGRVFFVGYNDLDEFINHCYPDLETKFEFVADEEMSNDSEKAIHVDGEVDEYDAKKIQEGETMYMTHALLNDACRRGLLKHGKGIYIIEVSW